MTADAPFLRNILCVLIILTLGSGGMCAALLDIQSEQVVAELR